MFPADEQLFFLHCISHHALPSAPLRQREEPGNSLGVDHDDICWSVNQSIFLILPLHSHFHYKMVLLYVNTRELKLLSTL